MSPLDALWHLTGFAAIPLLFAVVAAGAVKLVWRRSLANVSFVGLGARAAAANLAVALGGLVLTGRDGGMATWGVMVLACAAVLWWPLRR